MNGRVEPLAPRALFLAVVTALALGPAAAATADTHPAALPDAERLAAQAYDLHAAGKYSEAIATYLKAYEASNAGVILFNVAIIYDRKLHEDELAADYYRRFLAAADAEPHLVEKATARLTALKHDRDDAGQPHSIASAVSVPSAASESASSGAVAAPAATVGGESNLRREFASSGANGWRLAGFIAGGAGLAGVGTSVVLGALAIAKDRQADAVCSGAACATADGVRLAHDAGELATASTVAFFAGLGLAAGGLTVVLVAPRGEPSATRRAAAIGLSPQVGPTGAGLTMRGGF